MDHYCPFVLATIGYQNHSMFTLLTLYHVLGIGLGFFGFLHWVFYHSKAFTSGLPFFQMLCLGLFLLIDSFAVLSLFSFNFYMAFYHFNFCNNNQTTIDWFEKEKAKRRREYDQNTENTMLSANLWNYGLLYNLHSIGLGGIFFWLPKRFEDEFEGYYFPRKDRPGEWQPTEQCHGNKYFKDGREREAQTKEEALKESIEACRGFTLLYPSDIQVLIE